MEGPLTGISVVDVTNARAGPAAARQLADLGADVVHVEHAAGAIVGSDAWNLNRNKRSIHLDLKDPADHRLLLRLVDRADVFLENWRPAVKDRLGLSPETLLARNPRLVYGSISGFGQDGPYANRPAVDQVAQGMAGAMSVTGPAGTGPWRFGLAIADLASGTFLAQGVIAALFARERTGKGQWVHTSLLETLVHLLDFQAARWLVDGKVPMQEGNNHPTIPAMGTFETADGHINIGVLGDFEPAAQLLGIAAVLEDERFATHEMRLVHRHALDEEIAQALKRRTTHEWIERLAEHFPAGPVYRVPEVFEDPQVQHLGLAETVELADGRPVRVLRHPVTLTATPASIRTGPPDPGQHTAEVLAELDRTV